METVRAMQEVNVPAIVDPTHKAFGPLLEKNKETINSIPKKTFKYGATDRHQLDIYYPKGSSSDSHKAPILFFMYGGGLITGDRTLPTDPYLYSNVGSFYAIRGFVTIIPDYRLVPNVTFPEASHDIRDAVEWIVTNPSIYSIPESPTPDMDNIVLTGHSAGAIHLGNMLLYPPILDKKTTIAERVKVVVLSGGIYDFDDPGLPPQILNHYFGEDADDREARSLRGLLGAAPKEVIKRLSKSKVIFVESERELEAAKVSGKGFRDALRVRLKELGESDGEPVYVVGEEHNHISLYASLMSGEGESWAEEVVRKVKEKLEVPLI